MWHLLFRYLGDCFLVMGFVRALVFTTEFIWKEAIRGEALREIDFSCIKFWIFAAVCHQMSPNHQLNQLIVVAAIVLYTIWLMAWFRFHRLRDYSWPRSFWELLIFKGGPVMSWSG